MAIQAIPANIPCTYSKKTSLVDGLLLGYATSYPTYQTWILPFGYQTWRVKHIFLDFPQLQGQTYHIACCWILIKPAKSHQLYPLYPIRLFFEAGTPHSIPMATAYNTTKAQGLLASQLEALEKAGDVFGCDGGPGSYGLQKFDMMVDTPHVRKFMRFLGAWVFVEDWFGLLQIFLIWEYLGMVFCTSKSGIDYGG